MKLYLVQFRYSVEYEFNACDNLGIFDSMEKAEEAKKEFLDGQYLDHYDYAEVVIVEMEINKKTWEEAISHDEA